MCAISIESIDFYRSYCGLEIVKQHGEGKGRVAWLASPGEEDHFVLVLLGGGPAREQDKDDMTHYGFGVASRDDIDKIAERGRREGLLHWSRATMPADRLSLRRQRPDRLHHRVQPRPAARPASALTASAS